MNRDESVVLTQMQLSIEGDTMEDLLEHFRGRFSSVLIDDSSWLNILDCARSLPITIGAQPFGFELPLHARTPSADFGVTIECESGATKNIPKRTGDDGKDEVATALNRLFGQLDAKDSQLSEVVGHKLMLEYDIGTAKKGVSPFPGFFLRPDRRPIVGSGNRIDDVLMVTGSLASAVGWQINETQSQILKQVYLAQPNDVRMDSIGIFPARSQAVRLGVMGFESRRAINTYLAKTAWPGNISAVDSTIIRFRERMQISKVGLNIDVEENGLGPTLGLTFIVKQRYTNDPRYWLDDPADWDPFLNALRQEDLIIPEKVQALGDWVVKPSTLFGRSGGFFLLRGIHHIKLVIRNAKLAGAKAYVFFLLSAV